MKNIIITGGGMVNKGAQALTLITVSELRKRFPDHEIYLYYPSDLANPSISKEGYQFQFLGWNPMKFSSCQGKSFKHFLIQLRHGSDLKKAEDIYRNTSFIVDISGYALGSNWNDKVCNDFLDTLEFAQGFHIPVYLMPQSFGPFEFGPERKALDDRIRRLLPTAKIIYAREQEGYDLLVNTYGLSNVRLAQDLVLGSKEVDLNRVFTSIPILNIPQTARDSVGIIPNSRNSAVGNQNEMLDLYDKIIRELRNSGKTVYLLSHSSMDAKLCREIAEGFSQDDGLIYLDYDFSCLEFNELVQKFQFLIASRFHSIVHAYKNGIPCIVLGWATKYHDLLAQFDQQQYMFDVRETVDSDAVLDAVRHLEGHRAEQSDKILDRLQQYQKNNLFEIFSQM